MDIFSPDSRFTRFRVYYIIIHVRHRTIDPMTTVDGKNPNDDDRGVADGSAKGWAQTNN